MASLITPESASVQTWLVDLQLAGQWLPAFVLSAGDELVIARMENGQRKTETRQKTDVQVEPTGFHCDVRYELVGRMLEGTVDEDKVLVLIPSLAADQFFQLSDLDRYQVVNSSLPVFLSVKVAAAFQQKRYELVEELTSAALRLLMELIPGLPVEGKGGLGWYWPGVLEATQHVLKFVAGAPDSSSSRPHILPLLHLLTSKILTLPPQQFAYAYVAPFLPMLKTYQPVFQELTKEEMKTVAAAMLAMKGDITPGSEPIVYSSLDSLFDLIKTEQWNDLLPQWSHFFASVPWSSWTNQMLGLMARAVKLDKGVGVGWKEEGVLGKILGKITRSEKAGFMELVEVVPGLDLISTGPRPHRRLQLRQQQSQLSSYPRPRSLNASHPRRLLLCQARFG